MNVDILLATPQLDPVADLVACQHQLRREGWWQQSGISEAWPLSTDDAARMLAANGYDVDAERLANLIDRRLIPPPGCEGDVFEWSAVDVCHAAGVLRSRRQWLPGCHNAWKSDSEKDLESLRADGTLGAVLDGPGQRFDVRGLLQLLVEAQVHEGRRKIATLLIATLEHEHAVIV